jgi:hypothetical protein
MAFTLFIIFVLADALVVATKENFRFFIDFAKSTPSNDRLLVLFRLCRNDQSKERTNLPGVAFFHFVRISNHSGGKVGVPPRQFHSVSSVAS